MKPECTTHSEFASEEAAELLAEIRLQTECSTSLLEFAELMSDLLSLQQNDENRESEAELAALTRFLSKGLAEIRSVMAASQPSFTQIELLSEVAIDRWGEQIVAFRENSRLHADDGAWFPPEVHGELGSDESGELAAPSAQEIEALLGQFAAALPERMALQSEGQDALPADSPSRLPLPSSGSVAEIDSLDPELRDAFMADAVGCLSSMENSLLRLESNRQDKESLNQILRELHTLKGASSSVGLAALAEQIHHLEDSLRDDQTAGHEPSIDNLLNHVDQIRAQINREDSTATQCSEANRAAPSDIDTRPDASTAAMLSDDGSDDEMVRVKSSQLNRLMDMLVELVMLRNQRETELSELQDVYHELITSISKMRLLNDDHDLRAETSKSLQLSEIANDVLESAQHLRDCIRPFADGNAAVSRFIRWFRQELVDLRRTPISGLFRRLQRVVRDAARVESKQVHLAMLGQDAGIERALQQRLYEPLLHIVRNSVCHGIESPQDRLQSGKAPEGVISLEAKSGPDLFVIEIRDDGRGLDYEAIRRRGVQRGLLTADQVVSRETLAQLILHPGFSTRESADHVSGRGVGMDVVAATMQRMRGWLEVKSDAGSGTSIRLSFPLPSVIQHAMVFRSANQLFAFPMESVQAAGEVSAEVPRANLAQLLGLGATQAGEATHAIVVADAQQASTSRRSALLALFVDEIVGPEELVVRPLPALLKNHPFCVGATLSGMGQTVILLDARRVLQTPTARLGSGLRQPHSTDAPCQKEPPSKRPRVLVVDDSLSARKRVVRSLKRYPIDVVEATDGKEALELLKTESFAAIFSDMEMPNADGMELLAEVHAPDRSLPTPVVIVSSRTEREFTDRARQLGATRYLSKPLADEALDAALRDIASLRHLQTLNRMEEAL